MGALLIKERLTPLVLGVDCRLRKLLFCSERGCREVRGESRDSSGLELRIFMNPSIFNLTRDVVFRRFDFGTDPV